MEFTKEQLIRRLEEQESAARYALSFVQDSEILRDIEMDLRITEIALASLDAGSNSHPAHGPVSLDRLHQIREYLERNSQYQNGGNRAYILADMLKVIDEVLAGRNAEPVADVVAWASPNEERTCDIRWRRFDVAPGPLYTTPPVPVVPATLPCAVELKPGLIIGKGCKTETLLTALQRRADYYAEIDAMTPEERAEHDANIEAFKAMLPQPTPVVPEEATPKNIEMLASARVRNVTFQWDEDERNAAADSWNACRAAVLKEGQILSDSDVNRFGKFLAKKDGVGI